MATAEKVYPRIQAGGHENTLLSADSGDKVIKKTSEAECLNYKRIWESDQTDGLTAFNGLQAFIPRYYNHEKGKPDKVFHLTMDNLLFGHENASYMDIKLGISATTKGAGKDKVAKQLKSDGDRTTAKYGFDICGYVFNDDGRVENNGNFHPPELEKNEEYLFKLFNKNPQRAQEAMQEVQGELEKMNRHFQKFKNEFQIRGMSLFIVVDTGEAFVKLIDMGSIEEGMEADEGLVHGFRNLLKLFKGLLAMKEHSGAELDKMLKRDLSSTKTRLETAFDQSAKAAEAAATKTGRTQGFDGFDPSKQRGVTSFDYEQYDGRKKNNTSFESVMGTLDDVMDTMITLQQNQRRLEEENAELRTALNQERSRNNKPINQRNMDTLTWV